MEPLSTVDLRQLLTRLASRDGPRSEATVQADVRQLLLGAELGLDGHQVVSLEAPVGDRRRIDVEVGYTVIEVKRDLRRGRVRADAEEQLTGYVAARARATGQRYVGVLTDGAEWRAYHYRDDALAEVTAQTVSASRPDVDALLVWLEGVLATTQGVVPSPQEVSRRLGARSASHALDRATLATLYAEHGQDPSVRLKRELWAKLLRTALGTQFENSDTLFLEHTLLVNSAEVIAHAVLGFDVTALVPATLLSGQRFETAQVFGVVEEDFFDWPLEVPGGEAYVRALARRLARFDWSVVDHDVLKVLYESIIGVETRKRLGEYYTPDWLAEHMVTETVEAPLEQRVLDPACGSGTFLFHAVRRYLAAAEAAGGPLAGALSGVADHVLGIDLHPVAVALARVTYLLAIGRERLIRPERGAVSVPVYLGDSMQWRQRVDLLTQDHLVIPTTDEAELFATELRFPEHLLADAARFDRLVTALADLAAKPRSSGNVPSLAPVFRRLAIPEEDQPTITATFASLCRLHDEGRDHIWGYYVRNLARPVWLARADRRVDVLVGNPPWLAYRHMPDELQRTFRAMSETRGLARRDGRHAPGPLGPVRRAGGAAVPAARRALRLRAAERGARPRLLPRLPRRRLRQRGRDDGGALRDIVGPAPAAPALLPACGLRGPGNARHAHGRAPAAPDDPAVDGAPAGGRSRLGCGGAVRGAGRGTAGAGRRGALAVRGALLAGGHHCPARALLRR